MAENNFEIEEENLITVDGQWERINLFLAVISVFLLVTVTIHLMFITWFSKDWSVLTKRPIKKEFRTIGNFQSWNHEIF